MLVKCSNFGSLPSQILFNIIGLSASQATEVSSMEAIVQKLTALKTDGLYAASINHEFSKTGSIVNSYRFDRGNPFPGPLNGVAHHALDLEFIFGSFLEGFPGEEDVNLSKA
jgi:hypothetical protein